MGQYSRYPLGATVVAVTSIVFCLYTIVAVSTLVATVGYSLSEGCSDSQTGSTSFLDQVFKSVRKVIDEDESVKKHSWIKWLDLFETSEENCEEILQPVLGTLIAWDVIISILLLFTIILIVGILKRRSSLFFPYLAWLGVLIIFVFGVVIAIATRFPAQQAALVISCSMLFLIVPTYYWMVTFKHHKESAKTADEPAPQPNAAPTHMIISRKDLDSPILISGNVSLTELK